MIGIPYANGRPLTYKDSKEKEVRNTIWISLVFRMLCWLLLHDFDKADVKIVPSELKGSRMPIFFTCIFLWDNLCTGICWELFGYATAGVENAKQIDD